MTARKPVHPQLSPKPNLTFSDNSDVEYDCEDLEERSITPELDVGVKGTPVKPLKDQKIETSWNLILCSIIVLILGIICISIFYDTPKLKLCTFDKLQKQNPLQSDNVWKALQVGIENLLNKKQLTPNVYLFLYQDQSLQNLTRDIALETSRCFGHQTFIEMQEGDFITQEGDDYGYAIRQYKQKIKEGKVLVIINLNELPAKAARALHTICDTVNPIAKNVVIFLTLNPGKQVNPNTNLVELAVDTLTELWKQLSSNELDALITRVTDQILHLKPNLQ